MPEKVLPSEAFVQKVRVLEVGFGYKPAFKHGGSLFDNQNTEYTGVEFLPSLCQFDRTLAASIDHLPFPNNTFDYLMMVSMFGQFIEWPKYPPKPYSFTRVREGGLEESFRVLKPGGQIAVLEENTPFESALVRSYLESVGFSIVDFALMENAYEKLDESSRWREVRETFYSGRPTQNGPSYYFGAPYIVIGAKPKV